MVLELQARPPFKKFEGEEVKKVCPTTGRKRDCSFLYVTLIIAAAQDQGGTPFSNVSCELDASHEIRLKPTFVLMVFLKIDESS